MKEGNNVYAYISIVAIVAIVSVFVMFAGSGSKETSQPIVLDSGFGGDLVGDAGSILNKQKALDNEDPFNNLNEKEKEIYFKCLTKYGEENMIDRSEGHNFLEHIITTRNSKETEHFNEYMKNCVYLNGANKMVLFKGNNQLDLVYIEQDRFLGTFLAIVMGTFLVVAAIDITSQYCCLHEACWCCLWYYDCPQEW